MYKLTLWKENYQEDGYKRKITEVKIKVSSLKKKHRKDYIRKSE